jgi:hypothetical protein
MAVLVYQMYWRLKPGFMGEGLLTLVVVLFGGLVYGLAILLSGELQRRDIEMIPGMGPRLAKWLQFLKLVRR